MTQPFLSVVIPTYNRCDSLYVTLEALGEQTISVDQFEVLVVSDGSTDGTDEMVRRLSRESRYHLKLLTQTNTGPSAARNQGVRKSCGEVIVFLDDDVEPTPQFLAIHAAHHVRDSKLAVIGPMLRDP